MKSFHTYRDGLPPTPGCLANADSVDRAGIPLRIGDVIDDSAQRAVGLVVAIAGDILIYLVSEPDAEGDVDWFMAASASDVTIIHHFDDVLAEIAVIEATGDRIDAARTK